MNTTTAGVLLIAVFCGLTTLTQPACAAPEDGAAWKDCKLDVVPTPKQCLATGREFHVGREGKIVVVSQQTPVLATAVQTATRFLNRKGFTRIESARSNDQPEADLTILLGGPEAGDLTVRATKNPKPQGYFLRTRQRPDGKVVAAVSGADDVGTLYGACTFLKSLRFAPDGMVVRELAVTDEPALSVRGLSPQWAWYIGQRAPYDAALWGLERWKQALDWLAEYRFNMVALCTYGKFPFPLERYRDRCAVDLPFTLWNPAQGLHTVRWTHPASKDDFLGALVDAAHARGIRLLIYSCLNLQDEVGSHQWTNEEELRAYCDIQQHLLRRYGVDGFIFESGEFFVTHPDDLKRFGNDEWTRLKADVFLTRRYTEAIRAVKPDAIIGLVDHYLFRNWDERQVPQRTGLERWKAELPPETLVSYVHSPDAYDVFPPERIWTYVFGPKGGLKPAIQLHLSDFCDVPRAKRAAGAYYVTYDWVPHEPSYLCFAESAWGNYGGKDGRSLLVHSSEPGVGGGISGRVWDNIQREFYGAGSEFGEGLLTAAQGTFKGMWKAEATLRSTLTERLVPALDANDSRTTEKLVEDARQQQTFTEQGLKLMTATRHAAPAMISEWPVKEHCEKAVLLAQAQLEWAGFVRACHDAVIGMARHAGDESRCREILGSLRSTATSAHERIRPLLARAYFAYPSSRLDKFEFLAAPDALLGEIARLRTRFLLMRGPDGKHLRLRNVAPQAAVTADSAYPSRYGPGYYEPRFAADGKEGLPSKGIWVSAETAGAHFLELRFDRAPLVRGIVVNWALDASHKWVPRDFAIQTGLAAQWKTVLEAKDNKDSVALAKLDPAARTERVRVVITRGSVSRPRLAAINEIQVLAVAE